MSILDEKFKSIAYSSETENKLYKKVYIISLHEDNNHPEENIPYKHIISPIKTFNINNIEYQIPKLIKHLGILDKTDDKLIINDLTLNYIDDYIKNLSKIEKLLLILRSDLNNMDFYTLRQASGMVDNINLIVFEFELSINFFKTTDNVNKLENLKNLLHNIRNMISNKVVYLDILNSRILSIVSLSALPILVLMTIWSTTITDNASFLYKNNYKIAYRLTFLVSFILIIAILYKYRKDFY